MVRASRVRPSPPSRRWFVVFLLMSGTLSCGPGETDAGGASAADLDPRDERSADPEGIDRLRSLGYIGYAKQGRTMPAGATVFDEELSSPGYNLYTIHHKCRTELIDERGRTIRFWEHQPSSTWSNSKLLPNGDLLVVGWDASEEDDPGIADEKRYLLRFAWDGTLLWKRFLPAHHDLEMLDDGRILTLTFRRRPIPDVHPSVPVRDDLLTFLDADGTPIRTLSFYDMARAAPSLFPLLPVAPKRAGGAPWIDLFHGNSVQVMRRQDLEEKNPLFRRGNVLVCFRHQDRIAMVDPGEGRLIWAWGQGILSGPHDAQVLDNGNILLFDNGIARRWSRVLEIDPITGAVVWEYKAPRPEDFFSLSRGACQRLPNGNTLITDSDSGAAFEVTPSGATVWQFGCPFQDEAGRPATIARFKRIEPPLIDAILDSKGTP